MLNKSIFTPFRFIYSSEVSKNIKNIICWDIYFASKIIKSVILIFVVMKTAHLSMFYTLIYFLNLDMVLFYLCYFHGLTDCIISKYASMLSEQK